MPITELSQLDVSFRGTEANNIFLEPVFFDDDLRGQFRILGNVANKKENGVCSTVGKHRKEILRLRI